MKKSCFLLVILFYSRSLGAPEFIVNSTLDSTQRDPQVARDGSGNYVIVWRSVNQAAPGSKGDIYLQHFSAGDQRVGGEVLVNTETTGDQDRPSVAMNAQGDYVVVWASYVDAGSLYDIKARVFRRQQLPGPEFRVNTTTVFSQTRPSVAIDSAGNFIIMWDSWYQDGSDKGVYAQRFDAAGKPLGNEFLVNVTTAYSQARPRVRLMRGGAFLVIWESWNQDNAAPSGYGMYGRIYDAQGVATSGEIQLNTYTNDYQWFGDADVFEDNSFVAVWCSWKQDGSEGGIVMQRFAPSGTKIGPETIVNSSTINYQWLPKVRRLSGKEFAVVWSSWKQDGSREGVYTQFFDATGRKTSFETQVNTYAAGFQWEPDFIAAGDREILVTWSSWGQTGHDYDVVARRVTPQFPQGYVRPSTYSHLVGRSTTKLMVHVVDSLALRGDAYEVIFDSIGNRTATASIRNATTGDTVVTRFPVDKGEGIIYLTPPFQGLAVQIVPEFDLSLDGNSSSFANHSGTNLRFNVTLPTAGSKLLAPIDAALIWGRTDTSSSGGWVYPLDTAIGISGVRNVAVPFVGWNLADNEKIEMLVVESRVNQRWDPVERIVFRTPARYRTTVTNTHAEITPVVPDGALILPGTGDTNYVLTTRPIGRGEKFGFTATKGNLVDAPPVLQVPYSFTLAPNYPNPFNATTALRYSVPWEGNVKLEIYNILGQRVRTVLDRFHHSGEYQTVFDGRDFSSGIYFCRLESGPQMVVRKMVLMK